MASSIDFDESILQKIQKCIALRPVIVLGSGASCMLGMPGMSPLADYLMRNIPSNPIYDGELNKLKKELSAGVDLETSLQKVNATKELEKEIIHCTHKYILGYDQSILRELLAGKKQTPLSILLTNLCRTANPELKIITTNYDRLAEYAIEKASLEYYDGFIGRNIRLINGFGVSSRSCNKGSVELLKVHGSLDWVIDKTNTIKSIPDYLIDYFTYEPLIVTPGIRKYEHTHNDPFREVISRSDYAFDTAKAIICIGYGFNDSHIQPRLVRRIQRDKIPVVVMGKKLTPKAVEFLTTSKNKEAIGIEEHSKGSSIIFEDSSCTISSLPIWNLDTLLSFAI